MTNLETTIPSYKTFNSEDLAHLIAVAADDKKGADIVLMNLQEVSYLTDFFVIVTGFSKAQVRAIADSIEFKIYQEYGQKPRHPSEKFDASWLLMDYGQVIVHIFLPTEREFYNLEAFWGHAQKIYFSHS